ncbi:hypothetical protein N7462_009616 [Penicillium macrosclerotiorum]|uniref:uncharacterized protein n=1 Tax=Penicillium macrosclerotiorum TaxID=303699 RepID=UPI0025479FC5|nr:uncharacterized protein N7462_009616 [Penicillium macrosclerotiorum]KAJ5674177.1 hypothetical protein N7462_009616 [Penicillium macrosclerotiorum]
MSDVQSRPSARGRVSARGGRGGYSNRGGRGGSSRSNADHSDLSSFEESEIGQMKMKYSDTLPPLKELFSDWKDEDLVFVLEDCNGDLEEAIERISEGNASQWGEVKKKTDRKPKEIPSTQPEITTTSARASRGRGGFEGRGRARGDRGRGGRGGRPGPQPTNGARPPAPSTAEPSSTTPATEPVVTKVGEADSEPAIAAPEPAEPKTSVIPEGTKKGWASLFAKPAPPPPQKKPSTAAPAAAPEKPAEPAVEPKKAPEPAPAPAAIQKTPVAKPAEIPVPAIPQTSVKPPKDDLTETNLEQIPDVSAPAPTATAASTVGSAFDPTTTANATPSRTTSSALPSSALKQVSRPPGFQRRVMEQQQAVVMPGNHAVDRAAVQFGSMGLNGDAVDIDENREEAETRAQPPQHSPVAPRASLPPSTQGHAETPTARPAPGLPPVPQASAESTFNDFARYSSESQKPFDPFTQQVGQPQPQIQEPFANQAPAQPAATTGSEYSPFYAVDQQRFPYNYYGSYGQTQDATAGARGAAGFGVSAAEAQPQVPTTQPGGRYGPVDATNSGHNTPNPTLPGATQTPAATQHMPGQQSAHGYGYGYPYYNQPHYAGYMNQMGQHGAAYGRSGRPYDDVRRYDEQQHYGMPHSSQYGYGSYGPYGGKGGMYGQPHAFSYDHSSSPANAAAGTFNQSVPGRDSVYGRTGSAQPSDSQQSATGANAFSTGMSDVFGRSQAGFGQNPPVAQQPPVTAEETKGFEASKTGGPSPSLAQANRPGSATNNAAGQAQAQTGLPLSQGQQGQQGFGAYPHLNPQYGGLGGLGNHQGAASQTHQTGYGNYGAGAGAGFGNYYGNTGRGAGGAGGWGGNYGH